MWNHLFGLVGALAVAEVVLGKRGRHWLEEKLETLWLWFDAIRIPNFGIKEAVFSLKIFDWVFGDKVFSYRRISSTFFVNCIFISLFYVSVEIYRFAHGLPVRPPFVQPHLETEFPVSWILGMMSLYLTRMLLKKSISSFDVMRFSTLYFLLTIAVSSIILFILFLVIGPIFSTAAASVFDVIYCYIHFGIPSGNKVLHTRLSEIGAIVYFIDHGYMVTWSPSYMIKEGANRDDYWLRNFYREWAVMAFSFLRIILFIGFIMTWGIFRPLHRFVSSVIYRFSETENGRLTILVSILYILAEYTYRVVHSAL